MSICNAWRCERRSYAGGIIGDAIGSVIPGVGTAVGGALGSGIGTLAAGAYTAANNPTCQSVYSDPNTNYSDVNGYDGDE